MIWLLLVLYQLKHFTCDYILQGKWMLGKFKGGTDWILPLLAHSAVHGGATFLIALCVKPEIAFWVALFDTTVHFCMDRIKASPNMLGRYRNLTKGEYEYQARQYKQAVDFLDSNVDSAHVSADTYSGFTDIKNACESSFRSNTLFWWSLGFDQMIHALTHYAIIWGLL